MEKFDINSIVDNPHGLIAMNPLMVTDEYFINDFMGLTVERITDVKRLKIGDSVLSNDCLYRNSEHFQTKYEVLDINRDKFIVSYKPLMFGTTGWFKIIN